MTANLEDDAVDLAVLAPEKRRENLLAQLTDFWLQSGEVARHVSDIVALRNEIDDIRRDRTFVARNFAAWRAIINTRDAAILDLVSFGKTLYRDERPAPKPGDPLTIKKRRGILSAIAGDEALRALLVVGAPDESIKDECLRRTLHQHRLERFASLFPGAAVRGDAQPSQDDLFELGIQVRDEYDKIRDPRNGIGHRYELPAKNHFVVDFDLLIDIADHYQSVITTVMLLVSGNGYLRENTDRQRRDSDARELVDLTVFGSAGFMEREGNLLGDFEFASQRRVALYEFMHAKSKELGVEAINAPEVFHAFPGRT